MTQSDQSNSYRVALDAAEGMRVLVHGDKLMEFAYASKELYGWLEQNGGAPDEALRRWEVAYAILAGSLRFADRNLVDG